MKKMVLSSLVAGVRGMKPTAKNAVWMVGGAVLAAAITVSAQQASLDGAVTAPPCGPNSALGQAMSGALNNNISMIGLTQPDPTKYFASGGSSSFICGASLANLDLSALIPDVMGLLSDAATKAVNAAVAAACKAVTRDFGSVINQYNSAINSVNGVTSQNGMNNTINTAIGKTVDGALGQYATNYNSASSTYTPVLQSAGISNSQVLNGVAPVVVPTAPSATPSTSTTPAASGQKASQPSMLSCLLTSC
jgi:hypothetical protein